MDAPSDGILALQVDRSEPTSHLGSAQLLLHRKEAILCLTRDKLPSVVMTFEVDHENTGLQHNVLHQHTSFSLPAIVSIDGL